MDLDTILSNRYHILQCLDSDQNINPDTAFSSLVKYDLSPPISAGNLNHVPSLLEKSYISPSENQDGEIVLSIYLAENLEIPITPKPLCVIYYWQDFGQGQLEGEAIATKIYEIGQSFTLAPKVQAFFVEENQCYLVREYLEGYEYLKEFSQIINNLISEDISTKKTTEASTIKALPVVRSLTQSWTNSLAQLPKTINRRQLLISISSAIAGFTLALFLEKFKSEPKPIILVESPKIPEPIRDPIKRGDKAFRDDLGNDIFIEMVRIASGKFGLGSPPNESGRRENESPITEVNVSSFYMAKFTVTQEQWVAIMGNNPSIFRETLQAPVENISWLDAQEFCRKLAQRSQHLYRLPSEAEWEYACRAGTTNAYHFGDSPVVLGDYAWFADNANKRSHPVGQKVPNPWGLHEMHGGVWEWCEDIWHDSFNGAPADGKPWLEGAAANRRVRKGGSWSNEAKLCRSASREWHWQSDRYNDIGLRVVISTNPDA